MQRKIVIHEEKLETTVLVKNQNNQAEVDRVLHEEKLEKKTLVIRLQNFLTKANLSYT
jgi:hypothetical protein